MFSSHAYKALLYSSVFPGHGFRISILHALTTKLTGKRIVTCLCCLGTKYEEYYCNDAWLGAPVSKKEERSMLSNQNACSWRTTLQHGNSQLPVVHLVYGLKKRRNGLHFIVNSLSPPPRNLDEDHTIQHPLLGEHSPLIDHETKRINFSHPYFFLDSS